VLFNQAPIGSKKTLPRLIARRPPEKLIGNRDRQRYGPLFGKYGPIFFE
jgi:hypothetical protein